MRNPSGFGGVEYLGKKRRRPYRARKTVGWEMVNGKARQKYVTVGYFATRKEALEALANYNTSPFELRNTMTFKELYDEWERRKGSDLEVTRLKQLQNALRYFSPLFDRPFNSLKVIDYELTITEEVPRTVRQTCKTLLSALYKYAIVNEYSSKDYARLVDFKLDNKTRIERKAFTGTEMEFLWDNREQEWASMVLFALYTGFRPGEVCSIRKSDVHLDEGFIVGGSKTDAGRNRTVPIHSAIRPIVELYMGNGGDTLFGLSSQTYGRRIRDAFPEHTPHDTRHTFATQWKLQNLDDMTRKKIMGHAITDITEAVYTHLTIQYLSSEMEKLKY